MKTLILFLLITTYNFSQLLQVGQDINGLTSDQLGYDVSINSSGEIAVISAPFNSTNAASSGKVVVYKLNNNIWQQLGQTIYGELNGDNIGASVTINSQGNRIAFGALNSGELNYVKVFELNGSIWSQLGQTISANDFWNNDLGFAIDFDEAGNSIIIGAPSYRTSMVNQSTGKTIVYSYDNVSEWVQKGSTLFGSNNTYNFGKSVSIDPTGNIIAVGSEVGNLNSGKVNVFFWNGNDWSSLGNEILGESIGDLFGASVDLSNDGEILAVGAPENGSFAGQVKTFSLVGGGLWTQVGQTIQGQMGERIGARKGVSISTDGLYLLVAGYGNSENGINSGKAKLLLNSNSFWSEVGFVTGESMNDRMGQVQISANGRRIILGARYNADGGMSAGHARIYDLGELSLENQIVEKYVIYLEEKNIQIKGNKIGNICNVYSLDGKLVKSLSFDESTELSLPMGYFIIQILNEGQVMLNKKILID
jgi:hypothetical protein